MQGKTRKQQAIAIRVPANLWEASRTRSVRKRNALPKPWPISFLCILILFASRPPPLVRRVRVQIHSHGIVLRKVDRERPSSEHHEYTQSTLAPRVGPRYRSLSRLASPRLFHCPACSTNDFSLASRMRSAVPASTFRTSSTSTSRRHLRSLSVPPATASSLAPSTRHL